MLRSLKALDLYKVSASDGELGSIENFLFDDELWAIRYLVVAAGGILGGRRVLISPIAFRQADWSTYRFHLALTLDKIKNSPSVDTDKPVSRQHEREYVRYYGFTDPPSPRPREGSDDTHLRSFREVCGYEIQGSDAAIGHVSDFVVDDETWAVRYLVVDIGHWWLGKNVILSPLWASRIDWYERKVHLDLSREVIKGAPPWDPVAPVNREYETHLYDYYGRPVYWADPRRLPSGSTQVRET
jgi:hypothetical protein